MDAKDYLRIPAKPRGRLPRKYEFDKPYRKDRMVALGLLLCAIFWLLVYLVLR